MTRIFFLKAMVEGGSWRQWFMHIFKSCETGTASRKFKSLDHTTNTNVCQHVARMIQDAASIEAQMMLFFVLVWTLMIGFFLRQRRHWFRPWALRRSLVQWSGNVVAPPKGGYKLRQGVLPCSLTARPHQCCQSWWTSCSYSTWILNAMQKK